MKTLLATVLLIISFSVQALNYTERPSLEKMDQVLDAVAERNPGFDYYAFIWMNCKKRADVYIKHMPTGESTVMAWIKNNKQYWDLIRLRWPETDWKKEPILHVTLKEHPC